MPAGGILGLQGRKLQHYLDNYKVMTSMNMIMQQAVYKSTINSIFQIQKHYKLNFPNTHAHAGSGPETKD